MADEGYGALLNSNVDQINRQKATVTYLKNRLSREEKRLQEFISDFQVHCRHIRWGKEYETVSERIRRVKNLKCSECGKIKPPASGEPLVCGYCSGKLELIGFDFCRSSDYAIYKCRGCGRLLP